MAIIKRNSKVGGVYWLVKYIQYDYNFFLSELENRLQQMILLDDRINSGRSKDVRN